MSWSHEHKSVILIAQANIEYLERKLSTEPNPSERSKIEQMLKDERKKLDLLEKKEENNGNLY